MANNMVLTTMLTGFHPQFMFNRVIVDLIKGEFRSGNVYTLRQAVSFVGSVYKE